MITMAQRIAELRAECGMSAPALASALGFSKLAIEKFEAGRLSPTKEQQAKMASYFKVSVPYLRGEAVDRTETDVWLDGAVPDDEPPAPSAPKKRAPKPVAPLPSEESATMFDSFMENKKFQESIRAAVLDILRSPEGKALLEQAVRKGNVLTK